MQTVTSKINFIKKCFGDTSVSRCGNNVAVKCPKCTGSEKKKLSININDWKYHCWVCGAKGKNISRLVYEYASPALLAEYKDTFLSYEIEEVEKAVEEKVELPEGFLPAGMLVKSKDPDVRACINYLFSRNVSERDMWVYKLGISKSGKFRRRIIIPSFDAEGSLNYFSARSIDESKYKYINSKNKKVDIVFNEINIDWKKDLVIVEGPFDMLKAPINTTCLLGSSLSMSSELFRKIASNRTNVFLALDSDMEKKSRKIADTLSEYSCNVKIIDTSGFEDVGAMTKREFLAAKRSAAEWTREVSLMKKIGAIRTGSIF